MGQIRPQMLVTSGLPAIVRENAVRFCQYPNFLIGGWTGQVADKLKREHEALHRVALERAFMATRHGRAY